MPHLFKAFQQGDSSLTRGFGGLGLGLAIADALVRAHDGTITAMSPGTNRGASFTVELPTTSHTHALREHSHDLDTRASSVAPLRVLLVEDHSDTRRAMTKLLGQLGHRVKTADSVKDAIEKSEQGELDLLISDVALPDGTGHDVLRAIHQRHPLKAIAVSGFGMQEDIQRSLDAGFLIHLTKPVDFAVLQRSIHEVQHRLATGQHSRF